MLNINVPAHVNIWMEAFYFYTDNTSDKVSKWEYMESQKRMTMNIHD